LEGTASVPTVRLFNSIFTAGSLAPQKPSAKGKELGAGTEDEPTNEEVEAAAGTSFSADAAAASDDPAIPPGAIASLNTVVSNINNVNADNAGKIFEDVMSINAAKAHEIEINKQNNKWTPPAPVTPNITSPEIVLQKTLEQAEAEVQKQQTKELWFKKRLSAGGKSVLAQETFENQLVNGWAAVKVDVGKLPGGVTSPLQVRVDATENAIRASDSALSGPVWYWSAPAASSAGQAFLGAMKAAKGGTLSFDLNQNTYNGNFEVPSEKGADSNVPQVQGYETFADIILHGGSDPDLKWTLGFYMNRYPQTKRAPSSATWTKYEIPMYPIAGDPALGSPWQLKTDAFDMDVDDKKFEEVLGDLDTILIRGRYQTGEQTTGLRNVLLTGCTTRCENGATLLVDRCVCKCKPGFVGDRCETQTKFDFENLGSDGQATGMCLTMCRPKLKSVSSGTGESEYLECAEQDNINYYPSALPVAMLTMCSGEMNQLFNMDMDSPDGTRYRSAALTGYCLAKGSQAVHQNTVDLGFTPLTSSPLSVVMCSAVNPANLWTPTKVASLDNGGDSVAMRFSSRSVDQGQVPLCLAPHYPWGRGCADEQCSLQGTEEEVRQAVIDDCATQSNRNMFIFGPSQYFKQRNIKALGQMAEASHEQLTPEQKVSKIRLEIARALEHVDQLKAQNESHERDEAIAEEHKKLLLLVAEKQKIEAGMREQLANAYNEFQQKELLKNSTNATNTLIDIEPALDTQFPEAGTAAVSGLNDPDTEELFDEEVFESSTRDITAMYMEAQSRS